MGAAELPASVTRVVSRDDLSTELELYKLAVEMADRTSSRRAAANTYFITLNTALAALVGILSSSRGTPSRGTVPTFDTFGLCVASAAGVVLSLTWWTLLRYYRRLNRAKYHVINTIEKQFPIQPYTAEWAFLHPSEPADAPESKSSGVSGWWKHQHHREASVVEQVVPFVFAGIYLLVMVRVILWR